MKKAYIEPKITLVALKVDHVMCSLSRQDSSKSAATQGDDRSQSWYNGGDGLGRETVDAPDAWDEW